MKWSNALEYIWSSATLSVPVSPSVLEASYFEGVIEEAGLISGQIRVWQF